MNHNRKRNLIIAVTIIGGITVIMLAMCLRAIIPSTPIPAGRQNVRVDKRGNIIKPKSDTMVDGRPVNVYRVDEACQLIAPLAVQEYITDSPTRDADLADLFTENAGGLEIPIENIRHDDTVDANSGYVQTSVNDDAAICMVRTNKGVTWEVHYRDFDSDGYRASRIISHDEGLAYNLHPNAR